MTALAKAAAEGFDSVVDLLLDAGAHLEVSSHKGTPLELALNGGYEKVVEILVT
jgi:ankyrin repeat protein